VFFWLQKYLKIHRKFLNVFEEYAVFCTAMCKFFIKPPPDTQRTERQGERGIWDKGEPPPPSHPYPLDNAEAATEDLEDGLYSGGHEYDS
jgi:hypothetical protein